MTIASLLKFLRKSTIGFAKPKSDERVGTKLSAILFRQQAIGTLSVPVVLAAVLLTLRGEVAWHILAPWGIAYVLVTLVALVQCLLYFRAMPDKQAFSSWRAWHAVVVALTAAPHAALLVAAVPTSPAQVQIFLGVLFAGIAAGAVVLFAASLASALAYCAVTLFGLAAAFAISGGDLGGTLAILVVVYLAFLGNAARDFHAVLAEAIFYRISALDAQARIEQHAYDKGLSELATSILEKLRNELRPIAVKMGRRRSAVATTTRANLATALTEIADRDIEPKRLQKLAQFIGLTVENMSSQESEAWGDMQAIFAHLEAIEDVLVERDRFSGSNWMVEEVELAAALNQARSLMEDPGNTMLTMKIDPSVMNAGPVLADRFVLAHILRNLMLNSVEAIGRGNARQGSIEISVVCEPDSAGRAMAHLCILDNGCSIPPKALDNDLEGGYASLDGAGAWSRLASCQSSLAKFGGKLSFESEGPALGTKVHLMLPLAQSEDYRTLGTDRTAPIADGSNLLAS